VADGWSNESIRRELKARFPDRPIRERDGWIYVGDEKVAEIDRAIVGRNPHAEIDRLAGIVWEFLLARKSVAWLPRGYPGALA
jgi:hypothetical protein